MYNNKTYNKLFSYFTSKLGVREYRKGWLKGNCPSCGKTDKYGINLAKDRTNCFSCGYNPSPLHLVMELEDVSTKKEALSIVGDYREMEYTAPVMEALQEANLNLPEGYNNISMGTSTISKLARKYIKGRGFDIDEVSLKGWGYCNRGEFMGYIIMPFFIEGKLAYFNARRFLGGGVKYKNPSIEETGIGKSLVIYNIEALYVYKEVYMTEGLINAETIGDEAIAMGGKKVSEYQISTILKSPVESIVLLLDPDAILESIELAFKMVFHKKLKLVYWPGTADVNDIGYTRIMEMINNTPYINHVGLMKLKNKLNEPRLLNSY